MSDPKNPPAFPSEQHQTQDGTWNQTYGPGMSLRDWFAGQAIAACVQFKPKFAAQHAYAIADALLAERAKAEPQS